MSLSELAAAIKLGKPAALRLLRTLEQLGYLSRDGGKYYRLEAGASMTGMQGSLHIIRRIAGGFCRELQSKCSETVTLAYLFDDHIRVVDVFESTRQIKMSNRVGRMLQPYASSLGKAITAFQDEGLMQALLDVYGIYRFTRHTLVDQLAIQNEFAAVRRRGYAEDKEETVEGGYCIGFPLRTPDRGVVAAMSISAPRFRIPAEGAEKLAGVLKGTAAGVVARLETEMRKGTR